MTYCEVTMYIVPVCMQGVTQDFGGGGKSSEHFAKKRSTDTLLVDVCNITSYGNPGTCLENSC